MATVPADFIAPCPPFEGDSNPGVTESVVPRIVQLKEHSESVKEVMESRATALLSSTNDWKKDLQETLVDAVGEGCAAAILDKYESTTACVAAAVLSKDTTGEALAVKRRQDLEGKLKKLLGMDLNTTSEELLCHCMHLSAQDHDENNLALTEELLKEANAEKEELVKGILGDDYDGMLSSTTNQSETLKRKASDETGREVRSKQVHPQPTTTSRSTYPFADMNMVSIRQELGFISKEAVESSGNIQELRKALSKLRNGGFNSNPGFVTLSKKPNAKNEVSTSNESMKVTKKRLIHYLFDGPASKSLV